MSERGLANKFLSERFGDLNETFDQSGRFLRKGNKLARIDVFGLRLLSSMCNKTTIIKTIIIFQLKTLANLSSAMAFLRVILFATINNFINNRTQHSNCN
jgi:hypothetical protein